MTIINDTLIISEYERESVEGNWDRFGYAKNIICVGYDGTVKMLKVNNRDRFTHENGWIFYP